MRKYSLNNYTNVGAAIVVLLLCLRPTLDKAEPSHPTPAEKEDEPL